MQCRISKIFLEVTPLQKHGQGTGRERGREEEEKKRCGKVGRERKMGITQPVPSLLTD